MLNKEHLNELVIKNFAKWMDIRKRFESSNGGKVISAINESLSNDVNEALTDYENMHFLYCKDNNPEDVICYVRRINVGKVDVDKITIISIKLDITKDYFTFIDSNNYAYYENGYIYVKNKVDSITIIIDGFTDIVNTENYHVWNIYDEFASFLGMKRFDEETNTQLLNRIRHNKDGIKNSSESGLKNVIKQTLINYEDISDEDIKIEGINNKSLTYKTNDGEEVIEYLSKINHDISKYKIWDKDLWMHTFKTIKYMPHLFNVAIKDYQIGIGDLDDLKVEYNDLNDKASAEITVYEKSSKKISNYLSTLNKRKDFILKLKKYKHELKNYKVMYKILASKAVCLRGLDDVEIISYGKKDFDKDVWLQDVIDENVQEHIPLARRDYNTIESHSRYELILTPQNPYKKACINEICLTDNDGKVIKSLMEEKDGWVFNNNNLETIAPYAFIDSCNSFFSCDNVIDCDDGIAINSITKPGKLSLDISSYASSTFKIKAKCDSTLFDGTNLNLINCVCIDDDIKTVDDSEATKIQSENINFFQFKNIGSPITLIVNDISNGSTKSYSIGTNETFESQEYNTPMLSFIIAASEGKSLNIKNMRYTKFELKYNTSYGKIQKADNGIEFFPLVSGNNFLNIELKKIDICNPVINFISIGGESLNYKYKTGFECDKTSYLKVITDCKIELLKDGKKIEYYSGAEYTAAESTLVELNLDEFESIEYIKPETGSIEILNNKYYLKLNKMSKIMSLHIKGKVKTPEKRAPLSSYIDNIYKFYASGIIDGLVSNENIKKIIIDEPDNVAGIIISGLPNELTCVAKIGGAKYIGKEFLGNKMELWFSPENPTIHVAYNSTDVYAERMTDVRIVNTFNPYLTDSHGYGPRIASSETMIYVVESLDNNFIINFQSFYSRDESNLNNWTLYEEPLVIESVGNLQYNYEEKILKINSKLSQTIDLNNVYTCDNETIDLAEYNISSDYNIQYVKSNNADNEYVESFYCDWSLLYKLKYCNIDEILKIGASDYNLTEDDYSIDKEKGIIIFKNRKIFGNNISIAYTFKRPGHLIVPETELYKEIKDSVLAYNVKNKIMINDISDGYIISRKDINALDSDKIMINMLSSNYDFSVENNDITFKKIHDKPCLEINPGYYYFDGKENYLMANNGEDKINSNNKIKFVNCESEGKIIKLKQSITNYISNSSMSNNVLAPVASFDFKDDNVNFSNKLNRITACELLDNFKLFNYDLKLIDSYNNVGLKFSRINEFGYAYCDITECLSNNKNYISLLLKGDKEIYLYEGIDYDNSTMLMESHKLEYRNYNMNYEEGFIEFDYNVKMRYYLVIKGNVEIDDIVLYYNVINSDCHFKNMNLIGKYFDENKEKIIKRNLFNNFSMLNNCELIDDCVIAPTSKIKYYNNNIYTFNSLNNFQKLDLQGCYLENIKQFSFIKSKEDVGMIMSKPLYLGNSSTINRLIIKVNEQVDRHITVKVFGATYEDSEYFLISHEKNNVLEISDSKLENVNFIRFYIEFDKNTIINNINVIVKYKENDVEGIKEEYAENFTAESSILSLDEKGDYLLDALDLVGKNIGNIKIEASGAKDNDGKQLIWFPYKEIRIDENFNIIEKVLFKDIKYIKIKITITNKDSIVKINSIKLRMVK